MRWRPARRASSSHRRRRCSRASARPIGCSRASIELGPGPGDRPGRSRRAAGRRRVQPRGSGRRARRVRDSRRHRRHLSGRRGAAGPPRVHRRHDRVAPHLRPGARSDRSSRSIRSPSSRCATCWRRRRRRATDDRIGRRRCSTTCRAPGVADHRLRARRGRGERDQAGRAGSAKLRGGGREEQSCRRRAARHRSRSCSAEWDDVRASSATATALAQLGLDDDPSQSSGRRSDAHRSALSRSLPARGRDARARRRLGRRHPPAPRGGRDDAVRGRDGRPGRADDRAAEGIRRLRRAGRARRRRALRGGARGGRRAVARLPAARRRPADLRRSRRLRRRAARARAAPRRHARRFSPICAISRSAISSSTSITASACSSA